MRPEHVGTPQQFALASGYLAAFFASHAIHALATPFFQMTRALDPFLLSVVITFPMLFSMLLSGRIGRLCDGMGAQPKRRALQGAGWVSGTAFAMMWMASANWSDAATLAYLAVIGVVFYLASTLLIISLRSMTFALSSTASETLKVMSFTALFERLGGVLYFWLFPLAQLGIWTSLTAGIRAVGVFVGAGLIGGLTHFCANRINLGTQRSNMASDFATHPQVSPNLPVEVKNALLILLTLIGIKVGLIGAFTSLDFYLLVYYVSGGDIAEGALWKGALSTSFAVFSMMMIPVCLRIALRIGARGTLKWIYTLSVIGSCAKWYIYTPGNQAWLFLDALLGSASFVALTAIVPAMLNQLSHRQAEESQQAVHGYFASRQSMVMQGSILTALLLGGGLLNVFGFDASLEGQQDIGTITAFRYVLAWGTAFLNCVSLMLVFIYPKIDKTTYVRAESMPVNKENQCQQ
ncbi:MFS transporter [Alteromonas aestuariivivens]|uniref:MFS transporter n=1 Tax=Alteromonas aestuariivivens TaxID=1938339 RepID=A0A3D8MBV6_9ALTE|nr:MFS transporter [Alteromonas aestuariivivens]RDV27994.1 MFS transporter [Alteromonas aestuariivivens]